MKKIGIFGGTFSPPHIGHIEAAESFAKALSLDEILIMPDFLPPHKEIDGEASPEDRLEMCRLAFSHIPNVKISDFEIQKGGKSYTAITLSEFSGNGRELYFLCGTDMFLTLNEWYNPKLIFELATICVARREKDFETAVLIDEYKQKYIEEHDAKIVLVESDAIEISSSELRNAIKLNDSAQKYLTENVHDYILKKGIYK